MARSWAGISAFTIAGAIWLIVMQWVSSIFGGYIAGRLRSRWEGTHVHEVFFRDTAHGLVTWALATVMVAALAAASAFSALGGGARAVSGVVAGTAAAAGLGDAADGAGDSPSSNGMHALLAYGVDKLFRTGGASGDVPSNNANAASGSAGMSASGFMASGGGPTPLGAANSRLEASRIAVNALATGVLPDADRAYLGNMIAARTGLSTVQVQERIDDFLGAAKQAEERSRPMPMPARKDAAQVAIYTALAMLIGAFIASVSRCSAAGCGTSTSSSSSPRSAREKGCQR